MEFDFDVVWRSLPFIGEGLVFSLTLTLVAMSGGIVLGTLLAIARMARSKAVALIAAGYVNLMRSIPLVIVILWFFLIVPLATGHPVGAEASAFLTFTAFEAAYYCEIIRAGIRGVPAGQLQAGQSLGMTYPQSMMFVVLPQAFRNMLPVLLTQTIILFQDTSLVYAIGAKDLLKASEIAGKNYNRPVEMYVFVALVYFAICFSLSRLVAHLARSSCRAATTG
jgi:glutamate/aspartate transport system permease protein